ncbi:hypothetical protein AAVH_37803, partial [Aphelenchoides avenae]
MDRSTLLQRTPNPLDTAGPLQSGLHITHAVLQSEIHQGHQPSAKSDQQRNRALRVSTEQTSTPTTTKFTSDLEGPSSENGLRKSSVEHHHQLTDHQELFHLLQQTLVKPLNELMTPSLPASLLMRTPFMSPDVLRHFSFSGFLVSGYRATEDEANIHDAPPDHSDHNAAADSTDDRHLHHHQVTGEGTRSNRRATMTTAAEPTRHSTVRPALLEEDGAAAEQSSYQPPPRQQLQTGRGPVLSDLPSWQRTVLPPKLSSYQPPATTTTKTRPGASRPALLAKVSIAAEAASTSLIPDHQQISRFWLAILATSGPTATDATGSVDTERRLLTKQHRRHAHGARTERHAAATPTLAQAVVGRAARADPLDQEVNPTIFAPTAAANLDSEPKAANISDSVRCAPAEATSSANRRTMARLPAEVAMDHITSSAARNATPEDAATVHQPPVAYRAPAEAASDQTAPLQDDDIRVRRITRDDSPLKNETVCFCEASTFRHFGRLLRPEVQMIPTPVPSLEDALKSVSDLDTTKEVGRAIFWFSDSHAAPITTADQLQDDMLNTS